MKCLTKFFCLHPTVNIMLSELKDFIQNFDEIVFKFRIIAHLAINSMDDILEGFEITKPPDKRKLFSKLRRRVSIIYDSHIGKFWS